MQVTMLRDFRNGIMEPDGEQLNPMAAPTVRKFTPPFELPKLSHVNSQLELHPEAGFINPEHDGP